MHWSLRSLFLAVATVAVCLAVIRVLPTHAALLVGITFASGVAILVAHHRFQSDLWQAELVGIFAGILSGAGFGLVETSFAMLFHPREKWFGGGGLFTIFISTLAGAFAGFA